MAPLLGTWSFVSAEVQEWLQMLFSAASVVFTLYFWLVRANRERVSVVVHQVGGFEGVLDGGVGIWSGTLFVVNRSIMPTAIVAARAELWWQGRWLAGNCVSCDGSELPWNLPPAQAFAKAVRVAFDVGMETTRAQVYADQRLRITFVTVEGRRVTGEVRTNDLCAMAA